MPDESAAGVVLGAVAAPAARGQRVLVGSVPPAAAVRGRRRLAAAPDAGPPVSKRRRVTAGASLGLRDPDDNDDPPDPDSESDSEPDPNRADLEQPVLLRRPRFIRTCNRIVNSLEAARDPGNFNLLPPLGDEDHCK